MAASLLGVVGSVAFMGEGCGSRLVPVAFAGEAELAGATPPSAPPSPQQPVWIIQSFKFGRMSVADHLLHMQTDAAVLHLQSALLQLGGRLIMANLRTLRSHGWTKRGLADKHSK